MEIKFRINQKFDRGNSWNIPKEKFCEGFFVLTSAAITQIAIVNKLLENMKNFFLFFCIRFLFASDILI